MHGSSRATILGSESPDPTAVPEEGLQLNGPCAIPSSSPTNRRSRIAAAIAVILFFLLGADQARSQSNATSRAAGEFRRIDPTGSAVALEDVESPEALVSTLYDVISGPADEARDWDRLRSLFLPGARLTITRWQTPEGLAEELRRADVEGFIRAAGASYRQAGFWEREVWSRTERFGNVAHVFSTYESRVGSESSDPVQRGINSFQLAREGGRWWVAGIVWDVETPGNPIPDDHLPDPSR